MHLSWVELTDLRCYTQIRFQPTDGINVLIGANGAGKTTVLEGIAYLSSLRSFRKTPDAALIRSGADRAVLRGGFDKPAGETTVEVEIPAAGRRRILLNAKRPARLSVIASEVPVVAFLPDDLELVKGADGVRRRYLDELGAQLTPQYGAALADYDKTLKQRNALLRNEGRHADPMTLQVLDDGLCTAAGALWGERVRLVDALAPILGEAHERVAGGGQLHLDHTPATGSDGAEGFDPDVTPKLLGEGLLRRRVRELEQRTTTLGPHRDAVGLRLDGRSVRTQASQGEQRSVAVALRVASFQLVERRSGTPPVLLLDDVFSELDLVRTRALVEMLPRGQVLVTTTREDEVPIQGARWQVRAGGVTQ